MRKHTEVSQSKTLESDWISSRANQRVFRVRYSLFVVLEMDRMSGQNYREKLGGGGGRVRERERAREIEREREREREREHKLCVSPFTASLLYRTPW